MHHEHDRIRIYCHRCHYSKQEFIDQHSLAELAAQRRNLESSMSAIKMPDKAVPLSEATTEAIVWLLKGGVTPEAAHDLGIRWHKDIRKVLLPVRDEHGKYTGTLARAVDGSKPKYRMLNGTPSFHMPKNLKGPLVITEDILSAIAYVRAGYCGVAILGTALDALTASRITRGRNEVLISLDPDNAGRLAVGKVRKALALSPVEVRVIHPRRDPKYLPVSELKQLVETARSTPDARPNATAHR